MRQKAKLKARFIIFDCFSFVEVNARAFSGTRNIQTASCGSPVERDKHTKKNSIKPQPMLLLQNVAFFLCERVCHRKQ